MMRSSRILVVSLGLNLCALAAIVFLVKHRPPPVETVTVVRLPTNSPFVRVAGTNKAVARRPRPVLAAPFNWSSIEAGDYPGYIANLRAIGCPEETIKDIIVADVDKLYAQRRAELAGAEEPFEFWHTDDQRRAAPDLTNERQFQELENERLALLRQLLGEGISLGVPDVRGLAFLPEEKRQSVAEILARFRDLEARLKLEGQEFQDSAAGGEQLRQLRERQRAELAQVLTPAELENYDLRHSDLARQMRHDLVGFNPSEAEFRMIFRLRQKFADAFREVESGDSAGMARRDRAKAQLENSLKALLGEQRQAEYQHSKDSGFRELTELASENSLPRQTAVTAYDMQRLAEQQALKVSEDKKLSEEQKRTALEAIRSETEKSLKSALGEKAYAAYFPAGVAWSASPATSAEPADARANLRSVPPLPAGVEMSPAPPNYTVPTGQVGTAYGPGTTLSGTNAPLRFQIRRRAASPPGEPAR